MPAPLTNDQKSPDDCAVTPTAEQLIDAHLTHLQAGGLSRNTVDDARKVLHTAHRNLAPPAGDSPRGLLTAATEELADWLARGRGRRGEPWSVQTRSTYRQHLRRFYQWAVAGDYLDWDPSTTLIRPRVPAGVPRPATDEQAHIATTALPMPFVLAGRLAAFQGLRCIEMVRLHREHVTPAQTFVHGKGNRYDTVPTHPRVWEIVEAMPAGPLITRRRGWPVYDQWMSQAGANALRTAGAPITMHQLRHWYATWLLRSTGNMELVRQLMRHRSMASTQIYTLVAFSELRDAVLGLPDVTGP